MLFIAKYSITNSKWISYDR